MRFCFILWGVFSACFLQSVGNAGSFNFFEKLCAISERSEKEASPWSSMLYGTDWNPDRLGYFESDKLIQDFSYAGYASGERKLPNHRGPIFDVTAAPYFADFTGKEDATQAIQSAIDAAERQGGGVVLLPEGFYSISLQKGMREALKVSSDNIVIRGESSDTTFLLNRSTAMRGKAVIRFSGESGRGDFFNNGFNRVAITADLLRPTLTIPVKSTKGFSVGDMIVIRHEMTDEWVREHGEFSWLVKRGRLRSPTYVRTITSINSKEKELSIDIPIRYYLKVRDQPIVYKMAMPPLREVGIEHLSIGNVEHESKGWKERDYRKKKTGAYDAHASYLISFVRVRDSWAKGVRSFRTKENTTGAHMLSNGIFVFQSSRVTLSEVEFGYPQYGGGGGNGYMFRLQHANDCLISNCHARSSRHGFVFSHAGSNGNVLYGCADELTGRAMGRKPYETNGKGSDHHMLFSHSNLIDSCTAIDSFFEARYRPYPSGSAIKHGVTSAHTVFWNMSGSDKGSRPVVVSEQARYGYVIGTRGKRQNVKLPRAAPRSTDPVDHIEGEGAGRNLVPQSLYMDQLERRLGSRKP